MTMEDWSRGEGPGPHSKDGFAVEVTRRADRRGVPELLHAAMPTGASVLELGAGTGRISDALVELGHPTTAVDHSADMLALVQRAEPVLADLRECDLRRNFDAVVLATFLINVPDPVMRRAFLHACRRHVAGDGQVFIQRQPPERFDLATTGVEEWAGHGQRQTTEVQLDGDLLTLSEVFRIDGHEWAHTFTARRIHDNELPVILGEAGLALDRWLSKQWFVARVS